MKRMFLSFHAKYLKGEKISEIVAEEEIEEEHEKQMSTLRIQLSRLQAEKKQRQRFQEKETLNILVQNSKLVEELAKEKAENKALLGPDGKVKRGRLAPVGKLGACEAIRMIEKNRAKITELEEKLAEYDLSATNVPNARPS
jgi:hypothetical protein